MSQENTSESEIRGAWPEALCVVGRKKDASANSEASWDGLHLAKLIRSRKRPWGTHQCSLLILWIKNWKLELNGDVFKVSQLANDKTKKTQTQVPSVWIKGECAMRVCVWKALSVNSFRCLLSMFFAVFISFISAQWISAPDLWSGYHGNIPFI